jgi:hypothetical protein
MAAVLDLKNKEETHPDAWPITRSAGLLTSLRMFFYAHREAQLIDEFSSEVENIEVCIGHLLECLQSIDPEPLSLRSSH